MTIEKCLVTGLPTKLEMTTRGGIEYTIEFEGRKLFFRFSDYLEGWSDDIHKELELDPVLEKMEKDQILTFLLERYLSNRRYIIYGLLLNNKFNPNDFDILNKFVLDKIISESSYPKTPKEKLDNLFISLCNNQKYEGANIEIENNYYENNLFYKYYFKTVQELNFYLYSLSDKNYVKIPDNARHLGTRIGYCSITYEGLSYLIEITNEGENSNNCFIAMSFNKSEVPIFEEAIEPACNETGFVARRIDRENINSDETINDAMIALMKKCKFCISDFTQQKDGVYFESGYCLGRNMKVIYTCREDWFKQCHFDTNHFVHIKYKTNEELKEKLIDKINAWIK